MMKCWFLIVLTTVAIIVPTLQAEAPSISSGGVFNVASYVPASLPSGAIAQGSLFVVFGSSMGPSALQQASTLPLGISLGGTSLAVTVSGSVTKPLILYTSSTQIGALMPSNTPVGSGTISITFNGQTSTAQSIKVAGASVGIFTANQRGTGPGIITTTNYKLNTTTTSASANDVVIIWATGLGPVSTASDEASGTGVLATLPTNFKISIGGVSAKVVDAARSSSPGLDQIAFQVPSGITGCQIPVVVQTGMTVSNFVSMAIGTNGGCSDPPGTYSNLLSSYLSKLQQTGSLNTASMMLTRSTVLGSALVVGLSVGTMDSAQFLFYKEGFQNGAPAGDEAVSTIGSCTVYTVASSPDSLDGLDAGKTINLSGPNGAINVPSTGNGSYSQNLNGNSQFSLQTGAYTATSGGGRDVGAFKVSLTFPTSINWTNASTISTIDRASGQFITWAGGSSGDFVFIVGSALGGGFQCVVPNSSQQFTIPPEVLLWLPPTIGESVSFSGLFVGSISPFSLITAPGVDFGVAAGLDLYGKIVPYQ